MSLTNEDKDWIRAELAPLRAEIAPLRAEIAPLRDSIERVETSLLTEFHKWASPSEARQRTHTAALRAIDLEMEALSERVAKLEGK